MKSFLKLFFKKRVSRPERFEISDGVFLVFSPPSVMYFEKNGKNILDVFSLFPKIFESVTMEWGSKFSAYPCLRTKRGYITIKKIENGIDIASLLHEVAHIINYNICLVMDSQTKRFLEAKKDPQNAYPNSRVKAIYMEYKNDILCEKNAWLLAWKLICKMKFKHGVFVISKRDFRQLCKKSIASYARQYLHEAYQICEDIKTEKDFEDYIKSFIIKPA